MTVTLNIFEVFEIAGQIERNGARFYRKAAAIFDEAGIRKMFLRLAEWETEHEKTFAKMKKQLTGLDEEPRSFRSEEELPDPRVIAGLAVFGIRTEPTEELTGTESRADSLRKAIEKEKDSIVFYNGLKDFVSNEADKSQIDSIIREEMQHIRILNEALRKGRQDREHEK